MTPLVPFSHNTSGNQTEHDVELFTIGDLARDFNVTLRALRFYESRGLIKPRRSGLTRLYTGRDRARLAVILKGKQLGFTLQEIRSLLANEEAKGGQGELKLSKVQIEEQLTLLVKQRADLDEAIAELHSKRALQPI
jgi:DNA-binding transcriptional MerR regulator